MLNRGNKVLDIYNAFTGGISSTVVDPKLILIAALRRGATSIVLVHNHPSSSLTPSEGDIGITEKIKEACTYLDIQLLDHLIITGEGYLSFADEGIL